MFFYTKGMSAFLFADAVDPSGVSSYLFTQGVLGIAVLVLGYVCIYLYRDGKKKDQTIIDLLNARLDDSKENTKEVTGVLQDNSQNLRILSEKIEVGKAIDRGRQ